MNIFYGLCIYTRGSEVGSQTYLKTFFILSGWGRDSSPLLPNCLLSRHPPCCCSCARRVGGIRSCQQHIILWLLELYYLHFFYVKRLTFHNECHLTQNVSSSLLLFSFRSLVSKKQEFFQKSSYKLFRNG